MNIFEPGGSEGRLKKFWKKFNDKRSEWIEWCNGKKKLRKQRVKAHPKCLLYV